MRSPRHSFRTGAVIAILLLILVIGGVQGMQCLITVNTSDSDQVNPDIYGEKIVWEDAMDGMIHLYDIATGAETRVAPSELPQARPSISGSLVAWEEANPWFALNITYKNLLTGATGALTTNGGFPAADGQRIAWAEGSPPAILSLYNDGDGTTKTLVSGDDPTIEHPALSGNRIVWSNGSESTIYLKDIGSGDELLIASDLNQRTNPHISGDRVVWQDNRNGVWQVYLYDLALLAESPLTSDLTEQTNPAIDGTRVVWVNGSEIYLLDLAGSAPATAISSGGVNDVPRISSDRVVWQKYDFSSHYYDIYLSTTGSPLPCPGAGFTANPTSGLSPLTVQFTSTSSGSPDHWLWEFGDGTTSTGQNPVHTYVADGTYSVALTVGNPVGRDYMTRTDYIRVGPIPIISFTANQTYGIAPLPVRFTDTSSGSPASWSWDFGDGGSSTAQNPVHTYGTPGTYPVSLAATNNYGTGTGSMPDAIRVLNGVNLPATTDLDGLSVQTIGGRQEITLDTTKMVSDTFNPGDPASFSFIPQPASGWQRMTFSSSDGFGFARDGSGIIRGNLSSCTLESREMTPSTFTTDAGNNLPVSYRLDLSAYPPDAEINATVWEDAPPADDLAFRHALVTTSRDFTSIIDTAYTISFVTRNLDHVLGAALNLSVNAAWVQKNGNENNIAVVRLGDDGIDEVLNPTATFTDTAGNLDFFTVPSPHGLSRFALVSATGSSNLIQIGTRLATQMIQSSGIGYTSGGSSSKEASPPQNPPSPAPAQAERPAATYYGEGKIDTTVAGIARDPVIIASADHGASLFVDAGTEALDGMHEPLTLATAQEVPTGSVPAMPGGAGIRFTGMVYDMGPDGATFNPPATISFAVPDNQWDGNTQYSIRSYSTQTGSWDEIPTTVDAGNRIVSGQVSHLCLFGLFAVPAAEIPTQASVVRAPVATPQQQPKPLPRTPMGTFTGMIGWIYGTLAANPQVSFTFFLTGLAGLYTYTRRSWLSPYRTWITLYLISLTGCLWALFLFTRGEPLWEPAFLFTTIAGLNLVAHIFRFDRIDLTSRARYGPVRANRRW